MAATSSTSKVSCSDARSELDSRHRPTSIIVATLTCRDWPRRRSLLLLGGLQRGTPQRRKADTLQASNVRLMRVTETELTILDGDYGPLQRGMII